MNDEQISRLREALSDKVRLRAFIESLCTECQDTTRDLLRLWAGSDIERSQVLEEINEERAIKQKERTGYES